MAWKVEGDYFESYNCQSICPCIVLSDPSEGDCKLTLAWHIEKGYYESVKLDGLNVAAAFYAPGNMVTGPKLQAALYLDKRASPKQQEALGKIFSGQAGGFLANVAALIGEVKGVSNAQIEFTTDGKKRRLRIPSVLQLDIEGSAGADPNKESRVVNPAMSVTPGFDLIVAHSTKHVYKDHGMEWDNSGKNAFYCRFAYTP